jgi:lipopolysaccharide transport system permease protein/teichoic acid transport system permease protein
VKKVVFPLSILPVVKLVASFITHFVFLFVLICLIILYGMPFSIYWVQALYYFFAMCMFALGLSWITSSINIFARDTGQIVNLLLLFGFYLTPIFWDITIMPQKIQFFFKLNPMFYIVQGYRESFLYFIPFWHHWQMTLYFWGITGIVFVLGATIFLRLRPHFADVL